MKGVLGGRGGGHVSHWTHVSTESYLITTRVQESGSIPSVFGEVGGARKTTLLIKTLSVRANKWDSKS